MKKISIFSVVLALAVLITGCAKESAVKSLKELEISNSYVSIPPAGGSSTVTFKANEAWKFKGDIPEWINISATSGAANAETAVTFSADACEYGREAVLQIETGVHVQFMTVRQGDMVAEEVTCKEAMTGTAGKTYKIKGAVTKIVNTTYGNLYLTDGSITPDDKLDENAAYVYGTLDAKGAEKNFLSLGIEIGDVITIEGPLSYYGTTPELVNVTVLNIEKSLLKLTDESADVTRDGGNVSVKVAYKGNGAYASILDGAESWITLKSTDYIAGVPTKIEKAPADTMVFNFAVAANEADTREGKIQFSSSNSGGSSSAVFTLTQAGAIYDVTIAEYLAAPEDNKLYRISGIITQVAQDSDKYGANLYIQDATGKAYIYGTVGADGKAQTLASFGAKEGDIIEFIGTRGSFSGKPQMKNGQFQWYKTVTPTNAADVAALADDDAKDPKNYIMLTGKVTDGSGISGHKFDLKTYGNFDLVDESGSAYIYGVSTGWNGETKKFESLGVKEGDTITIVGYKTSYTDKNGNKTDEVVGMYVSHKSAQQGDNLVFTADVLPTAYADAAEVAVSGTTFIANQVANYGNGIQFKKEVGYVINKAAFTKKIKKVTCVPFAGKTWYKDNISVLGGSATDALEAVSASDDENLVYDFSGKNCTFFKIENASGYAYYLESITVEFE